MSIRSVVVQEMTGVANQQGKELPPLADDLALLDSELDSLCIAVLVARLDDRLGLDPFSAEGASVFPVTVGDFIRLYESAGAAV